MGSLSIDLSIDLSIGLDVIGIGLILIELRGDLVDE